ncbi:glycosyltransferase family 4 protein [Devosia sp.]|uniref:glycosyltransferase family 4 protein n=1 Tax=Devosia sp. TaxID=1871048 RepID=UPI00326552AA
MRILVVSQYFWPESFRINDVVTQLHQAGCDVVVLTGQPNYPGGQIFDGYKASGLGLDPAITDAKVYRVPMLPRYQGKGRQLALNYLSFLGSATLFAPWLLRGQSFDVIFVYGVSPILQAIPAIVLKWIKRAPLVVWVQDLWPQSLEVTGFVKNRAILGAVGAVTRWIYRRSDLVLGQSRAFVRTITAMSGKTPVRYHPSPGDIASTVVPAADPLGLKLDPGFNVVFAGNLGTAQALPTILDAATALRDDANIRFVLVGDGSRRDWVADEVKRRGLANVQLPGRFPPEAIPAILQQASAFLVSLSRSDILSQTVPAKISTYLAAAKPIIASLDGEGGQVVTDANAGIACPAEDAVALAAAVRKVAGMPEHQLAALGRSGRVYFDANLSPGVLNERLMALFQHAIDSRGSAKKN